MQLTELRLLRAENALGDIHRHLPRAATILRVRYSQTEMIVLYRA